MPLWTPVAFDPVMQYALGAKGYGVNRMAPLVLLVVMVAGVAFAGEREPIPLQVTPLRLGVPYAAEVIEADPERIMRRDRRMDWLDRHDDFQPGDHLIRFEPAVPFEPAGRLEPAGRFEPAAGVVPGRVELPERPAKVERPEKTEKPEKTGKVERWERSERPAKVERPEKIERVGKIEKVERRERVESFDRKGRR